MNRDFVNGPAYGPFTSDQLNQIDYSGFRLVKLQNGDHLFNKDGQSKINNCCICGYEFFHGYRFCGSDSKYCSRLCFEQRD